MQKANSVEHSVSILPSEITFIAFRARNRRRRIVRGIVRAKRGGIEKEGNIYEHERETG